MHCLKSLYLAISLQNSLFQTALQSDPPDCLVATEGALLSHGIALQRQSGESQQVLKMGSVQAYVAEEN